jgi:type IV pilus assembly protein PilO
MTLHFSRKQIIYLVMAIVFLVGVFYLTYFLLVKPVKLKIDQLENSVKTEERLLELISDKRTNDTPIISSTEIQKRIPVVPLVEQIVLDLERAETLSESRVISMSYSESEFTLLDETQPVEGQEAANPENIEENDQVSTDNGSDESQQTVEVEDVDPQLIDGLNQITVTLQVQSPTYPDLEKFLSVIEHQTRITRVESLSFSGTPELTSVDQIAQPLVYDVTISTFYMPKYTELAEEAPKLTVPPPSNKDNPLATGLEKKSEKNE